MKQVIKSPFFWITIVAVVAAIVFASKAKNEAKKAEKIKKQQEANPLGKFGSPDFLSDLLA